MIRCGTAYFPTFREACKYYLHYGVFPFQVQNKIHNGEIHIGKPPLKEGQKLIEVDEKPGLRYHIEEE